MQTVCCAFLQRSCERILILYVANRPRPLTNGSSATRLPPPPIRQQVMKLSELFYKLNPNINTTSFPRSLPRITAVDECDYIPKAPKIPHISILCIPVLSGSYHVWGSTHVTNPLNTNTIYITFTAYLTEMHQKICFALEIKRPSSLPTVRNQTSCCCVDSSCVAMRSYSRIKC